jgi:hypothetical protein
MAMITIFKYEYVLLLCNPDFNSGCFVKAYTVVYAFTVQTWIYFSCVTFPASAQSLSS